jgi:hypothetical protein
VTGTGHKFARKALLGAVTLAVALAGCGSTQQPGSFRSQAEAACNTFYAKTYALAPPVGMPAMYRLLHNQVRLRESELAQLAQITPTGQAARPYRAYVEGLRRMYALLDQPIAELSDDSSQQLARVQHEGEVLTAVTNSQAQALGLAICTRNPYTAARDGSGQGSSSNP